VGLTFPDGRRFAFTIMDDTDVATVDNVSPIYRLLERLGMRTTKTVWPVACPEGSADFYESETLEESRYREFVFDLALRGFEIAFHGATMESSTRGRTVQALDRFRGLFGALPRVHANHAYNRDNLYWGVDRLDDPLLRTLYAFTNGQPARYYQGHVNGSPYWWGDLASEITYVRNLTFGDINVTRVNPSMPYHDPNRPAVKWWFSAADAEDADAFNRLIAPDAQDRLEREGGVCIVATHLGKGFGVDGRVPDETRRLLERLASKAGWFVPVGELLDHLRTARGGRSHLPSREWRRMQWRWARDLAARTIRSGRALK
jgi:hypothetical protein